MAELGDAGQHPCDVLSFNDKFMMLYHDRRYVRLNSRIQSCIPCELWDRDFHKFASAGCIYCNGQYDDHVPRTLSMFVKPLRRRSTARWLAQPLPRRKQQRLNGWKVQKTTIRKVREASPNTISKFGFAEVESFVDP